MDTNHGQIFVNFGAPMSLFDYFQTNRSVYWCPNEPNAQILTKNRLQSIGSLAREIIEQQQKLYVLTTFNLICTYFNYRSLSNETCNLTQLKYGIDLLANFLKKFDALLSCDIPSTKVSNIIDSLEIHSNILKIQSNNNIRLVAGPRIANTTNVDPKKLKGHALSPNTMQRSLPSIVLQTYVNPCLFWLHQPAFYLLARKMNVPTIEMAAEVQRMKQIFVNEFITRNDASIGTLEESIGLWERLDIAGNDELTSIVLASIVPFVFCYFNVVDVIKSQLSQRGFTEKELYVEVQKNVEAKINASSNYTHPYCLSLDALQNALYSFVAQHYLMKKSALIDNKTVINYYHANSTVHVLYNHLHDYCSVLQQFNGLANYSIFSKM